MLDKPEFDCNNLGSFYDCGCADDEASGEDKSKDGRSATRADTPQDGDDRNDNLAVEISKEASVPLFPALR
jgi:FAD-linked sulfhydryl oxidase